MYKEIIICLIVIISIISINFYLQDYTKNSITTISDRLNNLKEDLKKENKSVIEDEMRGLHEDWENKYKMLAIFIEHDELEKVETNLVALQAYIDVDDYNMGINELDKGVFILKHIAEKYDFSIINVF